MKSAVKIGEDFSFRTDFLQNNLKQTEGLSLQGLLIALAFGERAWLDNKTWLIYQQTNTAHLIAISGLHIGLAMGIAFSLLDYCNLYCLHALFHPGFRFALAC